MKNAPQENQSSAKSYTCLALGDSYTIGEQVPDKENFPNQLRAILDQKGFVFAEPRIVAKTGWTTDELQAAINSIQLNGNYDWVTLLIGVNNQYRGRRVENYTPEFESLLKQAITFAGSNPNHVVVLSIPDWGVTPFAVERNRKEIAREINEYNMANELIAKKYKVHYINVTGSTREAANDPSFLTSDGLHPSGKEYAKWAKEVARVITGELQ